ncbi:MAG: hypothetical protein WAK17_03325 [Candidatus Nitrosopolaris sp.]|jgi:hypothetical protein
MMSIGFRDEVPKLHNIRQKFDILETGDFDLLNFQPNIEKFFQPFIAIQMQIHYYSCRLLDNKRGKIKID